MPLRRAFFLIPLVLACFAFLPQMGAAPDSPEVDCPNGVPCWIPIHTPPRFNVGVALLLTDGNIMVQENGTPNWYELIPDNFGFYRSGSWHQLRSMPSGYKPLYFASAVLKNGHVIIEGGEYNGIFNDTNLGAIYDPVANHWTPVPHPDHWSQIGDAPSVVLPNGTFMLGNCCDNPAQAALLDEASLTWTVLTMASGYAGKFDINNEEGWTLLPNGTVLTVDTYLGVPYDRHGTNSEIYDPAAPGGGHRGAWTSAGSTVVQLWDSKAACGGPTGASYEIGPAVLRPDGTVFATGSNTCLPLTAGHTAIFDTTTKTWTRGHDIPDGNDAADAPAAILPDGNVLVDTNPRYGRNPSTLYEYKLDGTGWKRIPQPPGLNPSNTEGGRMLVTPDGTILLAHVGFPQIWFYVPAGTYRQSWRPTITTCPATVTVGSTYTVSGTQFNGLSQGAAFGDDAQSATNYPIVRIRNNASGEYHFARTHGFSTMAVATGNMPTSTKFDVLPGTQSGMSTLQVIANGIPSAPRAIHVNPGR